MLPSMARQLPRKMPLAELHCHLGGAVTPAIMWGIAHAQGIKLPTKDYWEFRDMITVSKRTQSFDGYLQLFHWTELIQSSPLAVERSVYEVVGGAYRKNNVTTMELRFNPMKRNRGGEQDLDHIIAAAVRGMDKATLEYPVKPGLIFCLDRAFPYELNEIIAEKAIAWRDRGRRRHRHRRPGGVDLPGRRLPTAVPARPPVRPRADRPHRRVRPGRGGGPGRRAARARPHRPRRQGGLRPARDGDDPRARHRPRDLPDVQPQHARSCRAGTSSAGSSTRSGATRSGSRSTPTAPRCSRPTSATRWPSSAGSASCRVADQEQAAATSLAASFVPERLGRAGAPVLEPAPREVVEREEA